MRAGPGASRAEDRAGVPGRPPARRASSSRLRAGPVARPSDRLASGNHFVRTAPLSAAQPIAIDEVATRYRDLRIVIAHMGHPWILDTVVVVRKHPNVYADVSALHVRPWQLYNALRTAIEYGVWAKLLFGSDFPFFTPVETAAGLRAVADVWRPASLPPVDEAMVEELIERDGLALLGID
jgi:predicted TIM-barrel fold metal-dependent hydrolase